MDFSRLTGFEWDEANKQKSWTRHKVRWEETEEVFFRLPLLVYPDPGHSQAEERFYLLGRTADDRWLFIVFTIRGNKIRVISARDMSRKERKIFNEALKEST